MRLLTSDPFHETITEVLRWVEPGIEADADFVAKSTAWRSRWMSDEGRRIPNEIDAISAEARTEKRTPSREEDKQREPTTTTRFAQRGEQRSRQIEVDGTSRTWQSA